MSSVSLIIPTYNNEPTLRACLDSIKKQTLSPLEVIIADGHSSDETISIAKEFGCKIVFEEGGTRAAACNVALEAAERFAPSFEALESFFVSLRLNSLMDFVVFLLSF